MGLAGKANLSELGVGWGRVEELLTAAWAHVPPSIPDPAHRLFFASLAPCLLLGSHIPAMSKDNIDDVKLSPILMTDMSIVNLLRAVEIAARRGDQPPNLNGDTICADFNCIKDGDTSKRFAKCLVSFYCSKEG